MKCRLLSVTQVLNPLWSDAAQGAARDAGRPYDVPTFVEVGAGYIIDHPQAYFHCCPGDMNAPAIAEPVDDECREATRIWMEVNRPAGIAAIRAQYEQIDFITSEIDKTRLKALARAYGLIPDAAAKKAAQVPAA